MTPRRLAATLGALFTALVVTAGVLVAPPAAAAGWIDVWAYLVDPGERLHSINAGASFGIAGEGFVPGEKVTITYRGVSVTRTAKVGRGAPGTVATLPGAFTLPPDAPTAEVDLTATGSAGSSVRTNLDVEGAWLQFDGERGGPGGPTRLTGAGYASGATVSFSSSDGAVPGPVTASARGTFTVDVVLPTRVGDGRTVTADDGYRRATSTVVLQPARMVVDIYRTTPGESVPVTFRHFRPGATLALSADNPESGFVPPATVTVDGYGAAVVTVALPVDACPGDTRVTARDAATGTTTTDTLHTDGAYVGLIPARAGTGCSVPAGGEVRSYSGRWRLAVQTDGNLVLYDGVRPVWSTGTAAAGVRLVLQPDGNLVLYAGTRPLWSTGTRDGDRLVLRDDDGASLESRSGFLVWAPSTSDRLTAGTSLAPLRSISSPHGAYRLIHQQDGNVVLYGPGGAVLWAVFGYPADDGVILQRDGNFVVYEFGGRVLFTTRTSGAGNVLVVQDDGNLVVYSAAGRALWSRR